ncbi:hypothetical protein BOX15_Mlig013850g1 [Macrostomum lignano]|uniref:K Homology domain-containing protein n=1 Tax=Macrostomum lignano TaxID=282301 RepID=A0A267GBX2_9PLAT|nr:hypothetical protein BOX15_Mlig013850g1 [Macrostomum lignano]
MPIFGSLREPTCACLLLPAAADLNSLLPSPPRFSAFQYSAKVSVPDSNGPERVFTLEGEPDTLQSILRDLFNALLEESAGRDSHQGAVSSTGEIDMRLLVHQSQAGCVIGKAGAKIKELREESRLRALKVYSNPCPVSTDRVVQLVGAPEELLKSIQMVLELLELAPPKGQVANYDARNFDEFNYEQYGGWIGGGQTRSVRPDGIGNMGGPVGYGAAPPHHMGRGGMPPQPAAPQAMQRGGPQLGGPPMGGAMQPGAPPPPPGAFGGPRPGAPRGMETTQQVSIPDSLTGSIMGRGGQRIKQIRMESGADIKIDKGEPGQDRIITIRGSQEQIQNAQYLLQMCVKKYSGQY